jgi:hypothetical protein
MTEFITTDSGAREDFATGARRDTRAGKGRFDLITPLAMRRLAGVYERGAEKYSERNWEQGMPFSRFLDSAKRHLNDHELICLFRREGKPLEELPSDVNPNEDHLAQAAWNIFCLIHMETMRPDLNDLDEPAA